MWIPVYLRDDGYGFTLQQVQEKCQKQALDPYQCFIDLTNALDTVNVEARWKILSKLGFPEKFVGLTGSMYNDMKAWICVGGELLDLISVEVAVKQCDLLASTVW